MIENLFILLNIIDLRSSLFVIKIILSVRDEEMFTYVL